MGEFDQTDADPDAHRQTVLGRAWRSTRFASSTRRRRDRYVFYPRVLAPGTLADDLEWREICGAASLYTYTVAYRPVAPHFAGDVPQILAIVQWDEGPRFSTEIVNAEPDETAVGMRVRPVFFDFPDEVYAASLRARERRESVADLTSCLTPERSGRY